LRSRHAAKSQSDTGGDPSRSHLEKWESISPAVEAPSVKRLDPLDLVDPNTP